MIYTMIVILLVCGVVGILLCRKKSKQKPATTTFDVEVKTPKPATTEFDVEVTLQGETEIPIEFK